MRSKRLSSLEKMTKIKDETHKMEMEATSYPPSNHMGFINAKSVQKPESKIELEKVDDANDMLLGAIKAKLAILDQ